MHFESIWTQTNLNFIFKLAKLAVIEVEKSIVITRSYNPQLQAYSKAEVHLWVDMSID